MARKSFRQRFVFWLDIEKDYEAGIAETIDTLKQKRSFAKTIRDGIRLIVDLRAGGTDVLFELFPLLKAKLQADFGGNAASVLTEEKIRAIFREATSTSSTVVSTNKLPSLDSSHQNNVLPPPNFDDDMPLIEVRNVEDKGGSGSSSLNFIKMIENMQAGKGGW